MLKGLIIGMMLVLSPVRVSDVDVIQDGVTDIWLETSFGDDYYIVEIDKSTQTIEFY